MRARDRKNKKLNVRRDRKPRYLLSGLARCAECGGPMHVVNGKQGKKPIKVYACNYHRDRGNAVCRNTLRRTVQVMDQAVIGWIQEHVLTEQMLLDVLGELKRRVVTRVDTTPTEAVALQKEIAELGHEIGRMTEALATGTSSSAVIQGIAEREERQRKAKARMEALLAAPKAVEFEVHRLRKEARERLSDLQALMAGNVAEAREVLETLLDEPIVCAPVNRRYKMRAPLAVPEALGFRSNSVPSGI